MQITTPKPASACIGTPFAIQSTTKYVNNKVLWTKDPSVDGIIDNPYNENINFDNGTQDAINQKVVLRVVTQPITNDVCPPAKDSITILLHLYPVLDPLPTAAGCIPLTTNWTANDKSGLPASQVKYFWDFGNGDTSNLQNPTGIIYSTQGKYSMMLKAVNSSGSCETKVYGVNNVEAYPIPKAYFSTDPAYYTTVALPRFRIINQTTIEQNPFNPILKYNWNFGDGTGSDTSTLRDPKYAYGKDTASYKISLLVTSNHGCSDTISKWVKIGPDIIIYIPNVFTPDEVGPAINNSFKPTAQNFEKGSMIIFNRWGEKLYETSDLNTGWDGKANGAICQEGVYTYYIQLYSKDMKKLEFRGTVTLLR